MNPLGNITPYTKKDALVMKYNKMLSDWADTKLNELILGKEKPDKVIGQKREMSPTLKKPIAVSVTAREAFKINKDKLKETEEVLNVLKDYIKSI